MSKGIGAPSTTFFIRLCKPDDIAEVLEIRRTTFSFFAPETYSPKEVETLLLDVDELELYRIVENKSLFVAERGDRVVACGGWMESSVRHMYVLPEKTRQGIGSALLETLENDYRERTQRATIEAGSVLYAREFYEKNGYDVLGVEYDWDGSRFYRMSKVFV